MLSPKYEARLDYCHPKTGANAFHIAAEPRKYEWFTRLHRLLEHARSLLDSNSITSEALKSALNSLDSKGNRPLEYALAHAARMQHVFGGRNSTHPAVVTSCDVIAKLCQSGADPFAENLRCKETILVGACEDHTGAVLAALVSTSEQHQRIRDDYQYLHRAVSKGRNDAVDFLVKVVKCSPSLADPNRDGKNALHLAAARGEVRILATLVEAIREEDASILDSCDLTGSTALHYAAIADSPECVEYLLEARADHLIRNTERELAEEVATSAKVRSLFRQYQHEKKLARVEESVIKTKEDVEWLWLQQVGGQLSVKHTQATCRLVVTIGGLQRSGTAFLLAHRHSTLLITSRHVVIGELERDKEVTPTSIAAAQYSITRIDVIDCNGETFHAEPKDLHIHPIWDLAAFRCIIPVKSHFSLYLGNLPQLGQSLQVLGYPLDYDGKLAFFTTCTMGGIRNRGTAQQPVLHLLLSGGGVNPGNSGGPVIMLSKGHSEAWLVGVISHAPVRYSQELLDKLKREPEDSIARTCLQLFEQTKYVGITEAISASEVEKFLSTIKN